MLPVTIKRIIQYKVTSKEVMQCEEALKDENFELVKELFEKKPNLYFTCIYKDRINYFTFAHLALKKNDTNLLKAILNFVFEAKTSVAIKDFYEKNMYSSLSTIINNSYNKDELIKCFPQDITAFQNITELPEESVSLRTICMNTKVNDKHKLTIRYLNVSNSATEFQQVTNHEYYSPITDLKNANELSQIITTPKKDGFNEATPKHKSREQDINIEDSTQTPNDWLSNKKEIEMLKMEKSDLKIQQIEYEFKKKELKNFMAQEMDRIKHIKSELNLAEGNYENHSNQLSLVEQDAYKLSITKANLKKIIAEKKEAMKKPIYEPTQSNTQTNHESSLNRKRPSISSILDKTGKFNTHDLNYNASDESENPSWASNESNKKQILIQMLGNDNNIRC